jgi:hypothetical protein
MSDMAAFDHLANWIIASFFFAFFLCGYVCVYACYLNYLIEKLSQRVDKLEKEGGDA